MNRDANGLLQLIADKRLCRAIVAESPRTALALFQAIANTRKYGIEIESFARNIFHEALDNKDSFLYQEADGHASGLIGDHKPFTQAMFANYEMVVNIKTFLLPDEDAMRKWDAAQCEIYCRVVLISFRNYISQAYRGDSSELSWAMGEITIAASDLCTLNERSSAGDSDVLRRLALVIQFIKDAVRILDQEGVPDHVHIRVRVGDDSLPVLYGYIVTMIDTVISYTLKVSSPKLVRDIQYKSVWTKLFYHSTFNGPAGQVVAFGCAAVYTTRLLAFGLMRWGAYGTSEEQRFSASA